MSDPTIETTEQMLGLADPPGELVVDGSGDMFNRIAKNYDRLNRIISMGFDQGWRRKLVAAATATDGALFLDLATGTADVALALAKKQPEARVVGLDPSFGMLDVGRDKVGLRGLSERVSLIEGDAQALPFEDSAFDAITMSFGIRNVPDRDSALREMCRVLKPGGIVAILELGEPRKGLLAPLARWHVHHVVPWLGAWLSGEAEYRYLHESIAAFPTPDAFLKRIEAAGFESACFQAMMLDVAHLYVGRVPLDA